MKNISLPHWKKMSCLFSIVPLTLPYIFISSNNTLTWLRLAWFDRLIAIPILIMTIRPFVTHSWINYLKAQRLIISQLLILLSIQKLDHSNTMNVASMYGRCSRMCAWSIHIRTGNVLFNLVGYYKCLGYPFRGWTMILLQFRLY